MRVVLVGPEEEESLSIRYPSSSLRAAGHTVDMAVFNRVEDMDIVAARAAQADLEGLSMCFQVRAREFLELARRIKEKHRSCPVVARGHSASCAAEELLIHHVEIDVIVIHEGEQALVEIADAGSTISERMRLIRGIACRIGNGVCFTEPRPAVEDLDIRPTPDRRGPVRLIMVFHPEATLETIRSDLAFMRNHIDNPLSFARAEIYAGLLLNDR
jgi:radical SAM superfamily enzyme YgiQ (UPF0313 family)